MLCLQEKDAAREKLKYSLEEAIFMTKDIFLWDTILFRGLIFLSLEQYL